MRPPDSRDPAERERAQRRADTWVGAELILMGLAIPAGYVVLTVILFDAFTTKAIVLVLAASALCIALGITAIARGRRG